MSSQPIKGTGDINVRYGVEVEMAINAIAARHGMRRNEWLKKLAREALDADEQGRPLFQKVEGPRLDTSVNMLAADLRNILLEWDRVQRENERREMHLIGLWTGGEEANRLAFDRLNKQLMDMHHSSYQPFVEKLRAVRAEMEAVSVKCSDTIDARLDPLAKKLEEIRELASKSRVSNNYVFGEDWILKSKGVLFAATVALSFGAMAGLIVPSFADGMAVSQAAHLITSADRMCHLILRQYNVEDCNVPSNIRKRGRTDGMSEVAK